MRHILARRGLRYIFIANVISMLGSGMNGAAVLWYMLQATHSEQVLGRLVILQTLPAVLILPFSGVLIDREDRRRLVMVLDAARAVITFLVAVLAITHRVRQWQLYGMVTLVSAGFWIFWPTVTALIQEMTEEQEFVHANTFLQAGVQGGFLLAGAVVGFVYNHIGLGGVLSIDFSTYIVSFVCYCFVRRGRHLVHRPAEAHAHAAARPLDRFLRESRDGLLFIRRHGDVLLLGLGWALFLAAMQVSGVITAPLSDRILRGGAVGFGWLNAAWGVGAFLSAWYAPRVIRGLRARRAVRLSMALLSVFLFTVPFSRVLAAAVGIYFLMGTCRGIGGIAIGSRLMELVPRHAMGRVQNVFYFLATLLQLGGAWLVGTVAHRVALTYGIWIVGGLYLFASFTTLVPADHRDERAAMPALEGSYR